jgi:ADP-ribose pyrophosphatase YjhB (NUDIX family)
MLLPYAETIPDQLRFQFCPLCRTSLSRKTINDDGIARVCCPNCGWVHYPANSLGVNVVVRMDDGVVALLPPGEPEDSPAALPGGHVEYGECPEEAAVREAREETGLDVEVVRCLGWCFERHASYPGPMVSFMFETRAIGGTLRGGEEGTARVYPIELFPVISPNRCGSKRTMLAYLRSLRSGSR